MSEKSLSEQVEEVWRLKCSTPCVASQDESGAWIFAHPYCDRCIGQIGAPTKAPILRGGSDESGLARVSDFRCFQCKDSDDAEWVKACARTYWHQREGANFAFRQLGLVLAKSWRIDRLVYWLEKKLGRWGK